MTTRLLNADEQVLLGKRLSSMGVAHDPSDYGKMIREVEELESAVATLRQHTALRPAVQEPAGAQRSPEPMFRSVMGFNLMEEATRLRQEPAWQHGRNAKTLIKFPDLRIVLTVIRAGQRLTEHRNSGCIQESNFYYITLMNENHAMPAVDDIGAIKEGILKGMYKFRPADNPKAKVHAQLLASGAIVYEALKAQKLLAEKYDVAADVWSVTSYKQLYRDGHDAERWNMLHPSDPPRAPFVTQNLSESPGVIVAASDYLKALPDSISRWCLKPLVALGTDGFGRSDNRAALRDFFEVDYRFISFATLWALLREGEVRAEMVSQAIKELEINPEKLNPATA